MGSHTFSTSSETSEETPVIAALNGIRQLVRVLRVSATSAERSIGLSSAQLFILQQLASLEAASINELADRTLTDQSSVSTVVSRLEAKGLVQRARSQEDARRVMVHITPEGSALLDSAPPTVQTQLISALQTLTPAELGAFRYALTQIIDQIGAAHEPPTLFFEDDATGSH